MKLCILIEEKKSLIRWYTDQYENPDQYTTIEAKEIFPFYWQTFPAEEICHQEKLITPLREYIHHIAAPMLPLTEKVDCIIVAVPALLPACIRQSLQQALYDVFSCWNVLIYPLALFIPHRLEPGLSALQNKLLIQSVSAGYQVSLLSILGDGALCLEKQQHCDTLHKIRSWDRKYPITEVFFLNPSASDRSGLDSSRDDRLHFIHSEELLPSMPEVLSGPKPAVLYPFLPVLQSKHPSSGQSEQVPLTFDRYNLEFRVNGRYCLHLVELKQQHSYQLFELDHRHRQIPTALQWQQQEDEWKSIQLDMGTNQYSLIQPDAVPMNPEDYSFYAGSQASFWWMKQLRKEHRDTEPGRQAEDKQHNYMQMIQDKLHFLYNLNK